MRITPITLFLCLAALVCSSIQVHAQEGKKERDRFISSLIKKMTTQEKIAQLNLISPTAKTGPFATKNAVQKLKEGSAGNVYSIMGKPSFIDSRISLADSTRLKIPLLNGLDIIHGYKTVFPIPLGLSCSWDPELIEQTARVAAVEASAAGYNWTFSPMVDLTRDPRWGRVMEGSGEDPYLGSLIAAAMVRGYQGKELSDPTSLLACVKHFALYGAAEAGRDYNITDMSRLTMYQYYFPPYKAAIDAGALSVMTSFNEIEGVPATANQWLLSDLLRKQWDFKGFVVSDYNCIQELVAHGVAADTKEAAGKALKAGLDMDMVSEGFTAYYKELLAQGTITIKDIDSACRRVLEVKYKMGLLTKGTRHPVPGLAEKVILSDAHKASALKAAQKSIVLLQNNGALPLKKSSRIALVGPLADDAQQMFSMWSFMGDATSAISINEGLKQLQGNVSYAEGSFVNDNPEYLKKSKMPFDVEQQKQKIADAVLLASKSDVVVAVLGESQNMSGEAKSRSDIGLAQCQRDLLIALKKTGKPIILVLINGRPLTLTDDLQYADAVVEGWRPGTMGGLAIAQVLYGDYNPSGKLSMTFPRSVGQIPIYYNHKNTGRPYVDDEKGGMGLFKSYYIDQKNTPLYPFGYGLSYSVFEYGQPQADKYTAKGDRDHITITIPVKNTGAVTGEETVQLYLNDPVASVTRPVKELKAFKKIVLEPGEEKTVTFTLDTNSLRFYNNSLDYIWEPGVFNLYIGTDSENLKQVKLEWEK